MAREKSMFRANLYFVLILGLSVTASSGLLTTEGWAQEGAPQPGAAQATDDAEEASPAIEIG